MFDVMQGEYGARDLMLIVYNLTALNGVVVIVIKRKFWFAIS